MKKNEGGKEGSLMVFEYQTVPVRTVVRKNGEPVFALKDLCDILGIRNSRNVYNRLDDDEKGVHQIDTLGGIQEMQVVTEAGMYDTILRSDSPLAKPLRRFVTHEVLPTLRKTGTYQARQLTKQQLQLASKEKAIADANARAAKYKAKLIEELRKAIKTGDPCLIPAAIEMCRSVGIEVDDYDFGDGYDMGDDRFPGSCELPPVEYHDDGSVSIHKNSSVVIGGVTKTLEQWLRWYRLDSSTFRNRIRRTGMGLEEALTTPSRRPRSRAVRRAT